MPHARTPAGTRSNWLPPWAAAAWGKSGADLDASTPAWLARPWPPGMVWACPAAVRGAAPAYAAKALEELERPDGPRAVRLVLVSDTSAHAFHVLLQAATSLSFLRGRVACAGGCTRRRRCAVLFVLERHGTGSVSGAPARVLPSPQAEEEEGMDHRATNTRAPSPVEAASPGSPAEMDPPTPTTAAHVLAVAAVAAGAAQSDLHQPASVLAWPASPSLHCAPTPRLGLAAAPSA